MLKQNCVLLAQMPLRHTGGVFGVERTMWGRTQLRNMNAGEGITDPRAAVPNGTLAPVAWVLPLRAGGASSRNEANGIASFTAAGALGRNASAELSGLASLDAVGQLIVSATAVIEASATVSGNVLAALQLAATLTAVGNASGALDALGWAVAQLPGVASVTATVRANGALSASIEVGATGVLTAAQVSTELLDTQLVETGLTVRQTLRICLAALAGKASGANTSTVTFRNAGADTKDRIVATVDATGRTSVTLDVST